MITGKIIFISALDWGLGHATRCVPLIRQLMQQNKVIIGITPLTQLVFEAEFPGLEKINIPAYNIKYALYLPVWLKLLADSKRIMGIIKSENTMLETLIAKHSIDIVISDNRFGLHSKKAHCIFITHQLFLKTPLANAVAQSINKKYILNFDEVWVPDFEEEAGSLSGRLSHGNHFHRNVKYIGPQSRIAKPAEVMKKYDYLMLVSGPEPQSSKLKALLSGVINSHPHLKFAFVSHTPVNSQLKHADVFTAPGSEQLGELIAASEKIICRSGYSTLMDLYTLGKKELVLVPTPGQTEQAYLAAYWQQKFGAIHLAQGRLKGYRLQ